MKTKLSKIGSAGSAAASTEATRRTARHRLCCAVSGVVALTALVGCANPDHKSQSWWDGSHQSLDRPLARPQVRPLSLTVTGAPSFSDYYVLGRQAYFNGRLAEAEAAFRQSLRLAPDAIEPLNGLAVVHDRLGQFTLSAAEYQAALHIAPDAPHILANLGYSLLLQGRTEEALAPLRRAMALAPDNQVTRANLEYAELATAIAKSDTASDRESPMTTAPDATQTPIPEPMPTQVSAAVPPVASELDSTLGSALGSELTSAVATSDAESKPRSIVQSIVGTSQPPLDASSGRARLEMPMIASVQGAEMRASPALGERFAETRIEVSNGNGVTGMALALRARLRAEGLRATRATNAKPYDKRRTVIVCAEAQRPLAIALAKHLSVSPRIVIASTQHRNVDLRLILGADLIPGAAKPAAA